MSFLTYWLLIGFGSALLAMLLDYFTKKVITVADLGGLVLLTLFGAITPILLVWYISTEKMYKDIVVFGKKEDKQ